MRNIHAGFLAAVALLAFVLAAQPARAAVFGPDLSASGIRSNVTTQYYLLTTSEPNPTDVFQWQDCEPWSGGFDSGINSAQPLPVNQKFLSAKMPLGFHFPLLGQTFSEIQVSLNGWVSFNTNLATHDPANAAPTPNLIDQHPQRYVIAPYWNAFYQTLENGSVFCRYLLVDDLRSFVVQWHDVQVKKGDLATSAFFQLVLFEDGRMKFQYWDMGSSGNGANATIGVRIDDKYIEYSRFTASVGNTFAIEFTPSLTPPPVVRRTGAVAYPLPCFPNYRTDTAVAQFYIEPRLNEGTIESLWVQVSGPQGTNIPEQSFRLYILRDANEDGLIDAGDPVVSGLAGGGGPFLWDPWQTDDSVPIALYDSAVTEDRDNAVSHAEGRKFYLLVARFNNLIMGDAYDLNITGVVSPDLGFSNQLPVFIEAGRLTVEFADAPMAYGPDINPPLEYFDVQPDDEGVTVLSFSVSPAPDFSSRLRSFMVVRKGDADGEKMRTRFYLDKGTRGVYEPGVDVDVTAAALDSPTLAADGYTLGFGLTSPVIDIPLRNAPQGSPESDSPVWLPMGSEPLRFIAVLDLSLSETDENRIMRLSLVALTYSGERSGLMNLTQWHLDGSTAVVLLAKSVLRIAEAPGYAPDPLQYFVPGARNVRLASFAAYPSSRSGELQQLEFRLSGAGYDNLDITDLRVVLDTNANGIRDATDWLLWNGVPPSDNPSLVVAIPEGLGAFSAWQGGTPEDIAGLLRFVVTADFGGSVEPTRDFRFTTTALTFEIPGSSPYRISALWNGPRFEATAGGAAMLSVSAPETTGILIHTLPNAQVNAGAFRIYSGAGATRVYGVSLSLPTAVWPSVSHVSVFADGNRDRLAQGQEVLYTWTGSAGTAAGPFFAPLGKVDIDAGGTAELSVMLMLTGPTGDPEFQVSVSELHYAALREEGVVWYTPLAPNARGYTLKVVTTVSQGGSLGFTRGEGLTVGSPSFFTGGTVPLNLSCAICGGVETIRVIEMVFSHTGTLKPQSPHASSLRVVQDNGDGVNTPGTDTALAGSFTFVADGSVVFRPEALYLFPGSRSWFLLEGVYPSGLTSGLFSRIDLDPARCVIQGIEYTTTGLPRERTTGTAPAVYGSKVQGATLYFGTPSSGGGGSGGDDSGTPVNPSSGGGGGCFISTAAFGDMGHASVLQLTTLRDHGFCSSRVGSSLIGLYYSVSPTLANRISRSRR